MSTTDLVRALWKRLLKFVERINALLVLVLLAVSVWAGTSTYEQQQKNNAQDVAFRADQAQRNKDNAKFNSCFNALFSTQGKALPARSAAAGKRDDALLASLVGEHGFRMLLIKIGRKETISPTEYFAFLRTFDLLKARQDAYDDTKAKYPLAQTPAKFCDLPATAKPTAPVGSKISPSSTATP